MNQQWIAEFRGLFFGEGSVMIARHHKGERAGWYYRPRLMVALRDDDRAIVEDIQAKLGGYLVGRKAAGTRNRATGWYVEETDDVLRVVDLLLNGALIPSKKMKELRVLREYLLMRPTKGEKMSPEKRALIEGYYKRLRELKQFSC